MAKTEKVEKVLVDNRQSAHRHIPAGKHQAAVGEKHQDITLNPGINEVPLKEWEEAKQLPVIQALLTEESLVEIEVKGKPVSDIKALGDKQAVKLVKDTFDAELLEKWSSQSPSKSIAKAIEDQLEKLTKPADTEKA